MARVTGLVRLAGMDPWARTARRDRAPDRARFANADVLLLATALVVDLGFWGGGTTLRWGGQIPALLVIAAAVCVFGLLFGRRRRPVAAFVTSWGYTLVWGLLLPSYEPFAALLVATFHGQRWLPAGVARVLTASLVVPWAVNTWNGAHGSGTDAAGAAAIAAVWAIITAGTWWAARQGRRNAELARLRDVAREAQTQLALNEERLMLAREIHDVVAHWVTAIGIQAAGAAAVAQSGDPRVAQALRSIETASVGAAGDLRRLLGSLHGPAGTDRAGGAAGALPQDRLDLDRVVETARACGVTVQVHEHGSPRATTADVGQAAYRLVQESLTNVVKHRGPGSSADVVVTWQADRLEVEVSSHGGAGPRPTGASAGSEGLGIAGLTARLHSVGGDLQVGPNPSGGHRVVGRLPVG